MAEQISSSTTRRTFISSGNSWMAGLVPAGAVGIFAALMWGRPVALPLKAETPVVSVATAPVVPVSSTLVVGAMQESEPLALQGRLMPFDAEDVIAPASGLVARLLVERGQLVKAGQTIAMISNQAVPAQETSKIAAQKHAEAAQEAVARQQNILQGKLEQEQKSLKAANQRLDNASQRLANARELVRRLQNGEKIKRSEIDTGDSVNVKTAPSPNAAPDSEKQTAAIEAAQQLATQTAKHAEQKWQILHVLLSRQAAAKAASANDTSSDAPTQEAIETARANAQQAQADADAARMKSFQLQHQQQKVSKPSQSSKAASGENYITVTDATRIAKAALQESQDALAQVDAIQSQINRYQTPVEHTTERIESATSQLEDAQRALFNNPARVQMTPVVTASDGVVQSVMTLASQVEQGDKVASIAPANLLLLELRDASGLWKKLKTDDRFMVTIHLPDSNEDMPSVARLVAIAPPEHDGSPALLRLHVFNPARPQQKQPKTQETSSPRSAETVTAPPRWFEPGMAAACVIPKAGGSSITVPRAALRINAEGRYQVAVLQPLSSVSPSASDEYRVEWRDVVINNDDVTGAQVPILSGLIDGERIALHPQKIYQLTQVNGAGATVQINET